MILAAVMVSVVGSCGGGAEEPEAQPAPGVTRFTEDGIFDTIPTYPRSDPLGPRREVRDATVRTWSVRNATPEQVLRFYADALVADEWDEMEAPHAVNKSWRGSWRRQGATLQVSAGPAPTVEQPEPASPDPIAQYSLTLRPE